MNRTASGPPRKHWSVRPFSRKFKRKQPQEVHATQHNTTQLWSRVTMLLWCKTRWCHRATPPVGSHPHHQEEARPEHLTHLVPISQRWEEGLGVIRSDNSTPSNVHRLRCKRKRVTPEDLKTIEGRSRPLGERLRVYTHHKWRDSGGKTMSVLS